MRGRHWLSCAAVCFAALLATHLYDLYERRGLLKQFVSDKSQATIRIVERYGLAPDQCLSEQQGEFYPLAAALLTVESLATSHLQAFARNGLAMVAAAIGVGADFSIGPGRIKPSTAHRLIDNQAWQGIDAPEPRELLTRRLLDPCGSLQIAIMLLEDIRNRHGGETGVKFVRLVATAYNGQSSPGTSLQADIAARIYFDLVYNIYQHYRFLRPM